MKKNDNNLKYLNKDYFFKIQLFYLTINEVINILLIQPTINIDRAFQLCYVFL